jgi:hypothetical protein
MDQTRIPMNFNILSMARALNEELQSWNYPDGQPALPHFG